MHGLTNRQETLLDFVAAHIREHFYPPTLREIGNHMGIRSTNGVNDHMRALERKGYLRINELKSRGIVLTHKTKKMYGLFFSEGNESLALARVFEIIDGFPDSVDLSTSTGALQGADTVIRVIEDAIFDGLDRPEKAS